MDIFIFLCKTHRVLRSGFRVLRSVFSVPGLEFEEFEKFEKFEVN